MSYLCPVCGYDQLSRPPRDYSICPCCGTEFGYDDYATIHEQLRQRWMASGAHWFSHARPAPNGWNPLIQLMASGFVTRTVGLDAGLTVARKDVKAVASKVEPKFKGPSTSQVTSARGPAPALPGWTASTAEAA